MACLDSPHLIGAPARVGMGWLGDMLDKRRLMMGLLLALSFSVLLMGYKPSPSSSPCMIIYSRLWRVGFTAGTDSRRLFRHEGFCHNPGC